MKESTKTAVMWIAAAAILAIFSYINYDPPVRIYDMPDGPDIVIKPYYERKIPVHTTTWKSLVTDTTPLLEIEGYDEPLLDLIPEQE